MILSLKEKGETRFFDPISFSPSEKETNFATPFFSFSIRRKKRTVSHREEKKETTREPFGRFSGLSIDQSLALDLRRMEVGESTIDFVGADAERSCSRRRSVTDAACPLRVLIGPFLNPFFSFSARKKRMGAQKCE